MYRQIAALIGKAIRPLWVRRQPMVLARAAVLESSNLTREEAFVAGYRACYWEVLADMVEAGLVQVPGDTVAFSPALPAMADDS